MSKTETARGLSASAPSSQLIQQIRALQQQMEQSQQEIEALPPAIAAQVSEALEPLQGLSLTEIEKLAQIQRTTLDTMSSELAKQATASFSKSTRQLLKTINETSQQLQEATGNLASAATAATTLPEASHQLERQAQALERQVQDSRPSWWETPVVAVGSAVISAALVVVLIGLLDSSRLALLNVSDPELRNLLDRATPAEYELIREIYSRRAP